MKPSTRSRHFPHVSAGSTRSSYFKTRRDQNGAAKRHGTEEKGPVVVDRTDDGWMTERAPNHGYSVNRKIRRARERRRNRRARGRKSKGVDNAVGAVTAVGVGGELEAPRVMQEGTVIGLELLECGGATGPSPAGQDEAGESGGIRRAQTPVTGIPGAAETPRESPSLPLRKRKHSSTFEIIITNRTALEGTSKGQLGKYQDRQIKADREQGKSPRTLGNSYHSTDDIPEGVIVKELRSRNIVMADGFGETVRRKRSKYAGPIYEDTPSKNSNSTPPQSTKVPLENTTVPIGLWPDIMKEVSDMVMETPAKSIPRGGRKSARKTGKVSSYFASSGVKQASSLDTEEKYSKRRVLAGASAIPWPPLTAKTFGLIQEELENDAYYVIVAAVFLNKTRGAAAVPLLRQFLIDYPSPLELSQADLKTITAFLRPLGLHHTRADRLIQMGKTWMEQPPSPGMGITKPNYPARDTHPFSFPCPLGEDGGSPELGVEKNCIWEIAHLPGVGAYALDSWRIFCLDRFRNGAVGVRKKAGEEGKKEDQSEEWMRVVPKDKELRAYLRWRWAKEGWVDQKIVEVGGRVDTKKQAE